MSAFDPEAPTTNRATRAAFADAMSERFYGALPKAGARPEGREFNAEFFLPFILPPKIRRNQTAVYLKSGIREQGEAFSCFDDWL